MRTLAYTEGSIGRDDAVVISVYDPTPRYAKGGLHSHAERVRRAGRGEDEVLLHITPDEFKQLKDAWGEPGINPNTGLPEYGFLKKIGNKLGKVAKKVIASPIVQKLGPIAASIFLPGVGGIIASAALKGVNAKLQGAKGSDVLKAGAMGALGAGVGKMIPGLGGGKDGTLGKLAGSFMPGEKRLPAEIMQNGGIGAEGVGADEGGGGGGGFMDKVKGFFTNDQGKPAWGKIAGAGLGTLALLNAASPKQPSVPQGYGQDPNFKQGLTPMAFNRTRNSEAPDYYHYGHGPEGEANFFVPNALPQQIGGHADGGKIAGPGTGRSDDIDAKLSDGEYVMDAETVALLGDGSTEAGARRLDEMRNNLRRHKGRNLARGKFSHAAKAPMRYLPKLKKQRGGRVRRMAEGGAVTGGSAMRRLNALADQFQKALSEGDQEQVTYLTKPLTALHPDAMKTGYEAFARGGSVADAIRKLLSIGRSGADRRAAPRPNAPERRATDMYPNREAGNAPDLGQLAEQLRSLNPGSDILRQYEFEKNKRKLGNVKDIYDTMTEEPQ